MGPEIFHPEHWQSFFVMVGSGTAALAGLVFVAMTLHPDIIVDDDAHRYRAIGTLSGFIGVFMTCALALMGDLGHVALGIEWLILAIIGGCIYSTGYITTHKRYDRSEGLSLWRTLGGDACYAIQMIGAVMFIAGNKVGLYVACIGMVSLFIWLVSGAWLLLVGVEREVRQKRSK